MGISREKRADRHVIGARDVANETWVMGRGAGGAPVHYVTEAAVTPEVPPGGVVDTTVVVRNEALVVIGPLTDNECFSGVASGLRSTVEVDPSWTESETTTFCTGIGVPTANEDTFSPDFKAPEEPGTYDVDISATAPDGSGGTVTYEVYVPEPGDGDDGNGRPGDGSGGDDDEREGSFLGTEQVVALAAFSILVIVALNVSR